MRRALVAVLAALSCACDDGPAIPDVDLAIRLVKSTDEAEMGKAFTLTVVRVWSKELEPEPWNDDAVLPLIVRLEEMTRRETTRHVEETRRYRGYAFDRGTVNVPARPFKASPKSGGPPRVAMAPEISLLVKPLLDPKAPGPQELPAELLPDPTRWPFWSGLVAAILVSAALFVRSSRRRAEPPALPTAKAVSPAQRALDRIRRLREHGPRTPEEISTWYVEASSVVRNFLAEALGLPTGEMTTQELLGSSESGRILAAHRTMLAEIFAPCDLVKFAKHMPPTTSREPLLAATETLVRDLTGMPAQADGPEGPEP